MSDVKLWRYSVRKGYEWAIVMLSSAGDLAVISDYGNYAFAWRSFGGCFRAFLCGLDDCYLGGKLNYGRPREYDEDASRKLVREHIIAYRRDDDMTCEEARREWDLSEDMSDFRSWYDETGMCDASEFHVDIAPRQLSAFLDELWPLVVIAIRQGMVDEQAPASQG